MSFKQFYEKAANGVQELNEALERFYLIEAFSNGSTVKLSASGKATLKRKIKGAEHPALDINEYKFYEKLSSVPSDEKSDRELFVSFGTKKLMINKLLSQETNTITTDFISTIAATANISDASYDEKLTKINTKFSKEDVTNLIKQYVKLDFVKDNFPKEDIKTYTKKLLELIESNDGFNQSLAKNYNKIVPNTEDKAFNKFKSPLDGFGKYIMDFNKDVIGTSNTQISDEDLDYLMFGSEKLTKGFERAYASYIEKMSDSPKTLKLNRFYLYSENADVLLEIVYNEDQPDSTPEKMLDVVSGKEDGEEGSKEGKKGKEKKYNIVVGALDHESYQVLGAYFPKAEETYHSILSYIETNGSNVESQKFEKIILPFVTAIKTFLGTADRPQSSIGVFDKLVKEGNAYDYLRAVTFAAGVAEFKKKVAPSYAHIVYGKMSGPSGYRELETKKMGYKDGEYGKTNTADFLLSSVDDGKLLSLIKSKTTKLQANKNGSVDVVDEEGTVLANYFQVSLKTTKEGSSIGRTHSHVKKTFGDKLPQASREVFGESVESILQINEGIFDKLSELAKKGLEKLKELGAEFLAKVAKISNLLRGMTKTGLKTFLAKVNASLPHTIEVLYNGELKEAVFTGNFSIEKKCEELFARADHVALFNKANAKLEEVLNKIGNGKVIGHTKVDVKVGTPKKLEPKSFKRQIFHYAFITTFTELFLKGMSDSKRVVISAIHEIVDLYAEAIFGSTQLPLWKVYQYNTDKFELVGSREQFKSDKKARLEAIVDGITIMHLRGDTADKHLYIDFLVDVMDEDGKQTYAEYEIGYGGETGTSSSAKFNTEFKK